MRYIKQRHTECLLTSICQVVPSLDIDIERPRTLNRHGEVNKQTQLCWLKQLKLYEVLNGLEDIYSEYGSIEPIPKNELNLINKGIIIIRSRSGHRHSVSYEKHLILDPDYIGKKETINKFFNRNTNKGWTVEAVIQINRS